MGPEWDAVGQTEGRESREFHLQPRAAGGQAKEEIPLRGWVSPGVGSPSLYPFLILPVMISRSDLRMDGNTQRRVSGKLTLELGTLAYIPEDTSF